jgi:hypothetical protein
MAFPREAANQIVACPHCHGDTLLSLTKLMLVVGRGVSATELHRPAPVPQADTDRPLSRREQKALFASWRQKRMQQGIQRDPDSPAKR